MKNLKHYFLWWLIFSGTVIISFIWFAAYTNLPTQNTWDVITSTIWNNLVNKVNTIWTQVDLLSNVPTWAIMAFNLSTCPSWWNAANWINWTPDLRWEFIRWLDSWRWIDSARTLGSWQKPSIFTYHSDWNWTPILNAPLDLWSNTNNIYWVENSSINWYSAQSLTRAESIASTSYTYATSTNDNFFKAIRPRNVAFLYCIKQ